LIRERQGTSDSWNRIQVLPPPPPSPDADAGFAPTPRRRPSRFAIAIAHALSISAAIARSANMLSTLAGSTPTPTPTRERDPFAIAHALSSIAYSSSSFTSPPSLATGSGLHAQCIKLGVSADTFTTNHLLIFYKRRGHLAGALRVFDEMPHRNLVSWTAMVSGSVRNAAPDLGLQLFVSMLGNGLCPNEFALACALGACCQSAVANARLGLSVHGLAVKAGLDANPYVGSSLMLMYARHGRTAAAEHVFAGIVFRDLACWNAMLEAYISNGYACDAMRTVVQLHRCGITPDVFTYISAVKASSINSELNFGRQLHGLVIHNRFESSTSVMNALVDMYFKAGHGHSYLW